MFRIGVISDTHGLLRPEAVAALTGSEHILHGGDIGDPQILIQLGEIAPVTAIVGNVDAPRDFPGLHVTAAVELAGKLFYLVHAIHDLDLKPESAGVDVIVTGHSHSASVETKGGVVYLNPGSAGPRRFRLPTTVARVLIADGVISVEIVALAV